MANERIRVLLVYHGAAWAPSRKLFGALAAHPQITLRVLAPRCGRDPATGQVLEAQPGSREGGYELVTGSVHQALRDFARPYVTGLAGQMIRFRPDVVFVMNEVFSDVYLQVLLYRNVIRRRAKVLFYGFENLVEPPGTKRQRVRWRLLRRWGDGGAYANSEGLARVAAAGFPDDNLALTYWGVPLDAFTPARNEALRDELGVNGGFLVGYVGRLAEEKGLADLLDAMAQLPANVRLLCVGDGPWRTTLEQRSTAPELAGRITHVRRVPDPDVPGYLNALDALVLPSRSTPTWQEQFGRVLPEAMGCGVPVIGSDSGAIPEVIGGGGRVFAEGDSTALAATIGELAEAPALCRHLAEQGLCRARKHFSCEAFAGKLVRLFERVADRPGRGAKG